MSACMVRHQIQGFGQLRLGGDEDRSATAQVAGFVSEWRPASFRNSGRHQIGIGGRIASEFASHCDIRKFKGFSFAKMPCETPSFCDKFRMIAYGRCRSLIGSISTENPHYQAVKSGFRRNFSREIPYATFLFRSAVQAISSTTASLSVSGRPRHVCVMWQNNRCSILFHFDVPGG